jgi:putative sterol carrier protein
MATLTAGFSDTLRRSARRRGRRAFQGFVRRASDVRLERTAGSDVGLRLLFAAMARAYEPDAAQGFAGEIQYDLIRADGRIVPWTVRAGRDRAAARPGRAAAPALTLTMGVPDFLRMAAGELDAGRALLTGRLDLAGDFALAQRLAQMFGRPAAL